jgi:hypothetical protein
MMHMLTALATLIGVASIGAQLSTSPDVAGAWNLSLQGHQVALVLEQKETAVSGTLMLMGTDIPVQGTFDQSRLALTGSTASDGSGHLTGTLSIAATLKDDGTLAGELETARGTVAFTGERLKRRPRA